MKTNRRRFISTLGGGVMLVACGVHQSEKTSSTLLSGDRYTDKVFDSIAVVSLGWSSEICHKLNN